MKQRGTIQVKGDLPKKEGLYLYQITNNFDNMIYIGQTNNPYRRKGQHTTAGGNGKSQRASHMYNSMRKHGRENFTYEIISTPPLAWHLSLAETYFIAYYKSQGTSYNNANGGDVNRGWKQSEEAKAKLSEANKGENNPMYGTTLSAEAKAKMCQALQVKCTGENHHNYKYDPVVVASFDSPKAAREALGMGKNQYGRIKKANPELDWPVIAKGRPTKASSKTNS